MHEVTYNQLMEKVQALQKRCQSHLVTLGSASMGDIATDLELLPLKIAFVGQYSAGKSSLIKMLTGISSIRIGAGVTTDKVTPYEYKGLHIVDTPGIRAGHCETHDDLTLQAISEADLLVFVITNELFDGVLGAEFRNLCFKAKRDKELLIVINKSQNDSADPQIKLSDICSVLDPLIPENFPIVFMDAASYFDALEEDDEQERHELLAQSNREGLVIAIDSLVASRGIYARLTTPLQGLQNTLQTKLDSMLPGTQLEKGLLTLLSQYKRLFLESKRDLHKKLQSRLDDLQEKVVQQGNVLADAVGSGNDVFDRTQFEVNNACKVITEEAGKTVRADFDQCLDDLTEQVQALARTPLSEKIQRALEDVNDARGDSDATQGPHNFAREEGWRFNTKMGKSFANAAGKGFSFLGKSATGKAAKGGLKAASGSSLHETIKHVGEFVGYKFKAWEAVKLADTIGKGAKFLGPVMAVAGVGLQLLEDHQQKKLAAAVLEEKRKIRKHFSESAENTKTNLKEVLSEKLKAAFDGPLSEIEDAQADLRKRNDDKSAQAQTLLIYLDEIAQLRADIGLRAANLIN